MRTSFNLNIINTGVFFTQIRNPIHVTVHLQPPAGEKPALLLFLAAHHRQELFPQPDEIPVKDGQPLRLHFTQQESSTCSERVLFPDFNQNALLPEGQEVTLEFTPCKPGEYGFQCTMGMFRGKLIVE